MTLKSKLEALENRKLEEQVNLTISDDQGPTAAKEAAEGGEIWEDAHGNLEEGSQAKDENSVEIEHTVLICNTPDDRVPTEPKSSIFCHYFNNFDACRFIEITGRQYCFLHRRSPKCRFWFACNRKKCMYVHDIPRWPLLPTPPPFPWQHPPPIWHSIPAPRTLQQFWQD